MHWGHSESLLITTVSQMGTTEAWRASQGPFRLVGCLPQLSCLLCAPRPSAVAPSTGCLGLDKHTVTVGSWGAAASPVSRLREDSLVPLQEGTFQMLYSELNTQGPDKSSHFLCTRPLQSPEHFRLGPPRLALWLRRGRLTGCHRHGLKSLTQRLVERSCRVRSHGSESRKGWGTVPSRDAQTRGFSHPQGQRKEEGQPTAGRDSK